MTLDKQGGNMARSNKGLYIGVIVIVVIAIIVGIVVAPRGNEGEGGESGDETSQEVDLNIVTAEELADASDVISLGDYAGMESLSSKIQNGEMTGKIVKIEGIVSHPGSVYSIVEEDAETGNKIGTQFIIQDAEESDYPEDGERVIITGKVVEESPLVFVIKTLFEFVVLD